MHYNYLAIIMIILLVCPRLFAFEINLNSYCKPKYPNLFYGCVSSNPTNNSNRFDISDSGIGSLDKLNDFTTVVVDYDFSCKSSAPLRQALVINGTEYLIDGTGKIEAEFQNNRVRGYFRWNPTNFATVWPGCRVSVNARVKLQIEKIEVFLGAQGSEVASLISSLNNLKAMFYHLREDVRGIERTLKDIYYDEAYRDLRVFLEQSYLRITGHNFSYSGASKSGVSPSIDSFTCTDPRFSVPCRYLIEYTKVKDELIGIKNQLISLESFLERHKERSNKLVELIAEIEDVNLELVEDSKKLPLE